MATFFENLWNSVFTPGTTPTLLIATNVTFAALQLVLGALLVGTRSIHFAVLSALCAGLWWAINWFAIELKKAEKAEEEAKRLRKRRSGLHDEHKDHEPTEYGDDESETETETDLQKSQGSVGTSTGHEQGFPGVHIRGGPQKILGVMRSAAAARGDPESEVQIKDVPAKYQALLRDETPEEKVAGRSGLGPTSSPGSRQSLGEEGSVGTDSEWEKVSDR
jgi:hypothetical protein